MATARLYRSALAIPISYRAKVVGLAMAVLILPAIALIGALGATRPAVVAWALAGSAIALAAILELLRPIGELARAMDACAAGEDANAAGREIDEVARMLRMFAALASEIAALRRPAGARHPTTSILTREPFLQALDLAHQPRDKMGMLGVVRLVDYDRLASFDQAAADRALGAFARRLAGAVRKSCPLGHVDQDCFALWFADIETPSSGMSELKALAYVLGQEFTIDGVTLTAEVTVGAAVFPRDAVDGASLLTRASAALPKPGAPTSAAVGLFSSHSADEARERFSLEQSLRQALRREELFLEYQPVVDLAPPRLVGAEALLRWRHPQRGLIGPTEFIPVLEECGMMEEIGLWVLNVACRQARAWRRAGLDGLKMAVNVSAHQLHGDTLLRAVSRTLERHGLEPQALELELTESVALDDPEETRRLFAGLRDIGVSVAIDDFGTGFSSLSSLRNLPFTKLKIDREFVTRVDQDKDNQAICRSLVELARGLEIEVLAEGAESLAEVQMLDRFGCSMFQGHFFSRSLGADVFVDKVVDPQWLALLASPVHREIASLERRVAG